MAKQNKPFAFTEPKIKALCEAVIDGDELPGQWSDSASYVGLVVRAGRRGGVYYSVRKVNQRLERKRIGSVATMRVKTAREEATKIAAGLEAGSRPIKTSSRGVNCQHVFDSYMEAAQDGNFRAGHNPIAPSTAKSYVQLWNPHIAPIYGGRPLASLADDIERIHAKFNKHGNVEARPAAQKRLMQLLKNVFEHATRKGWWKLRNPLIDEATGKPIACRGTPDRERFLSDGELKVWIEWVENQDEPWPDYYRLLLLTGIRKSTVCSMAWKDIDISGKDATWRLASEQTKNKKPLVVPLLPEAVKVLKRRMKYRQKNCKWVFPSPGAGRKSASGHLETVEHSWDRMKEETGIDDIRPHDVRRTAGSTAARAAKHSLPEVARFLGQRTLKAVAIYARAAEHEAREVGSTIAEALRQAEE